ncbi:ClpP/crotonase [Tilletiopsis washingtonensis]|uniref:ClpP/crotonase n=1 Tax=Tilletiopsis washingtonensis TaxID=58919 RepID=A0A316Z9F0_9BASI|nr:ClpP/crotonase [Tilletiopsis washingtonensis]PWN96803.1 ClpP/crotonase [Tilletiopsis washingtonensis]
MSNRKAQVHHEAHEDGIHRIVLDRPDARNAISSQRPAGHSPLRCLVIASSSACFCAGADLVERKTMSEAEVVAFLAELRRVFDRVAAFPVPTIAAIDGPALGGGLELALACDFRVADSRVQKLGFPEVQLGIIPGAGGTQRAPRLLGPTKAKELIYTGRLIDAKLALDWGLLDYVSEKDQTGTERALELAKGMARSAPLALASAKAAINRGQDLELAPALQWEQACYEELLPTEDRREALSAFADKRVPVFHGR